MMKPNQKVQCMPQSLTWLSGMRSKIESKHTMKTSNNKFFHYCTASQMLFISRVLSFYVTVDLVYLAGIIFVLDGIFFEAHACFVFCMVFISLYF